MNRTDLVKTALKCFQNSLGQDFKKGDIEVGVVDGEKREIEKLTEDEIEGYLKAIQNDDE